MSCTVPSALRSSAPWGAASPNAILAWLFPPSCSLAAARGVNLNESPKTIIPLALGRARESQIAMTGGILGLAGCAKLLWEGWSAGSRPHRRGARLQVPRVPIRGSFSWGGRGMTARRRQDDRHTWGQLSSTTSLTETCQTPTSCKPPGLDDVEVTCLPLFLPPPPHPEEEACLAALPEGEANPGVGQLVQPGPSLVGFAKFSG